MFEEILAERPVPEALRLSLDALRGAASQCQRNQDDMEQCGTLIIYCQALVFEAERQLRLGATSSLVVELISIERSVPYPPLFLGVTLIRHFLRACIAAKQYVDLFHSSLAWILLHREPRLHALAVAEAALVEAYAANKVSSVFWLSTARFILATRWISVISKQTSWKQPSVTTKTWTPASKACAKMARASWLFFKQKDMTAAPLRRCL